MTKTLLIAAVAALALTGPVHAFGGKGGDASASAAAAAKASSRSNSKSSAYQSQSSSVEINEAKIPRVTGSLQVLMSSMANDACGRVALGVPYSAHTCNVIREASTMASAVEIVEGPARALEVFIQHTATSDRTMRNTWRKLGYLQ